ncbi:hypothetical protein BY996DRAFT_8140616 [Phakopsora pachyrhizi]|nr:hypothetical protein BY996DRAFT_8140616 [Phakopsora pachyrhizi]
MIFTSVRLISFNTINPIQTLEDISRLTALETDSKTKSIKDRLESYLSKTRLTNETLVSPNYGASFPEITLRTTNGQPRSTASKTSSQSLSVQNSRAPAWEKVDPEIWRLYKEFISTGEVMEQRRKELTHKQMVLDDHVELLMRQADLSCPSLKPSPSRNTNNGSLDSENSSGISTDQNHQGENERLKTMKRQRDTVAGMVEALSEGVEEDPAVRISFLVDWIAGLIMFCLKELIDRFNLILKWWIEMILMSFQAKLQTWSDSINSDNRSPNKNSVSKNHVRHRTKVDDDDDDDEEEEEDHDRSSDRSRSINDGYFEIQLPSYFNSNVTNTGQNSVARIDSMRAMLFTALDALAGYFEGWESQKCNKFKQNGGIKAVFVALFWAHKRRFWGTLWGT